jgi:PilZ domain
MRSQRASGEARAQFPVRVQDLSLSGAQIILNAAPAEGTVQEFMLDLAGEPFLARALVRRCQPVAKGRGFEVGIEFVDLGQRDAERLKAYVVRRVPRP